MIDRLVSYYRTAVYDIRYHGIAVVLSKIVTKLVLPVARLEFHILYEFDLTRPIPELRPRIDVEYRIELAEESDLVAVLELQLPPAPAVRGESLTDAEEFELAKYERHRAESYGNLLMAKRAGEICFLFRVGDELLHCNWMRFASCAHVAQRPVELDPDEIYMTDGYTAEQWRGKWVHVSVNNYMLRYAKERGFTRAWTITDSTKGISRNGLRHVGWRRSGQLLYITPRRLHRTWLLRLGGNVEPMFRRARRESAEG